MKRLNELMPHLMQLEGGYVNHPKDPGGETKYGISKKSYPYLDIRNLSEADAIKIYHTAWWQKYHFHVLPQPFDAILFLTAINIGAKRAIKLLQLSLGIKTDGILGPKTLKALKEANAQNIHTILFQHIKGYYLKLIENKPYLNIFKKGWLNRLEYLNTHFVIN